MSDCCGKLPPRATAPEKCPNCGERGKKVARLTVMALLRSEVRPRIRDDAHRICLSTDCDLVYFGKTDRFDRADLTTRVGQKETAPDRIVCYCFGHTFASIRDEIERTGRSTATERITREVKAGRCACEATNPEGRCCLGNVARAEKEAAVAKRSVLR